MNAEPFVNRILDDEGLTEDLDDTEAQAFLDWLVGQAKAVAAASKSEAAGWKQLNPLLQKARALAKVVSQARESGSAAAADAACKAGLPWPPPAAVGPDGLLTWALTQLPKARTGARRPARARKKGARK